MFKNLNHETPEMPKFEPPRCRMIAEEKNTILFELGFIVGVLYGIDKDGNTAAASDSCAVIKEIINKY